MKLIVDIHERDYQSMKNGHIPFSVLDALMNGTPLPKHHGRLIDEDALEFTCNADECGMLTGCNHCQYHIVTEHELDNAPTIIEGSEE